MSRLTEVINQFSGKRESQLNETKTAGEKVSVLAHGRPAIWVLSMSAYTGSTKRDFGDRAAETSDLWQCGNVATMSTTLTEGVGV